MLKLESVRKLKAELLQEEDRASSEGKAEIEREIARSVSKARLSEKDKVMSDGITCETY